VKTDSIFYRLFKEFPNLFFELIGAASETVNVYHFTSVEVKQTAFRIDGVFLPTSDDNPIYFVEVQFQYDSEIYSRLFSEVCLYLRQNKPKQNWRGVVIYPSRNIDSSETRHYEEFFASGRVRCVYLNELGDAASLPIGIATIKLIVEDEDRAIVDAGRLIERTKQEAEESQKQNLLSLIETIVVYKFQSLTRKEIQAMFGLGDLQKTRVYQEAKEEGREEGREEGVNETSLRFVRGFLKMGLTLEQIAQAANLTPEEIQAIAQQITPVDGASEPG
jgi:predicted transposase/invertase (TIGR01784 family)